MDFLVRLVGYLEFNVPFQHKYGYIRDEDFFGSFKTSHVLKTAAFVGRYTKTSTNHVILQSLLMRISHS